MFRYIVTIVMCEFTIVWPELRRAVRTSTWQKKLGNHVHEFPTEGEEGGETYNEETDSWSKTCSTCGYTVNYEKM